MKVGDQVALANYNDDSIIGELAYLSKDGRFAMVESPEGSFACVPSELTVITKHVRHGYVNIFRITSGIDAGKCFSAQHVYDDYNFAVAQGKLVNNYVDTAKVEWNCES